MSSHRLSVRSTLDTAEAQKIEQDSEASDSQPVSQLVEATRNPYELSPTLASVSRAQSIRSIEICASRARSRHNDQCPVMLSSQLTNRTAPNAGLMVVEIAPAKQGLDELYEIAGGIVCRKWFEGFTLLDLDVMAGAFEVGKLV
jgi:hypothetical protein